MTEHTPLPVSGYTKQSDEKVDLVNFNKYLEELVLRTMDAYKENPDIDQRWLAIARTDLEKSFMALNRSIFKPARMRQDQFDKMTETVNAEEPLK